MNTIRATGHLTDPPTLTLSGGSGNTDQPEIHIIAREVDDEETRTIAFWVNRDALLDAIAEADPVGKCCRTRVSEPADPA